MNLCLESIKVKKRGFTLAEVLVTIAILGIIATVAMPIAIQNFQKSQIESKFRMAYSILSRAVELSEVYTGPSATWEYSNQNNEALSYNTAKTFAETYLIPNLNVLYICNTDGSKRCFAGKGSGNEDSWYNSAGYKVAYWGYGRSTAYAFRMKNGMSIAINAIDNGNYQGGKWNQDSSTAVMKFTVDIDGPTKGKSIMGRDVFVFTLGAINPDTGSRLGLIPGVTNLGTGTPSHNFPCTNGGDGMGSAICGTAYGCDCAVDIVNNNYKLPYKITSIASTYKN